MTGKAAWARLGGATAFAAHWAYNAGLAGGGVTP